MVIRRLTRYTLAHPVDKNILKSSKSDPCFFLESLVNFDYAYVYRVNAEYEQKFSKPFKR